MLPQSDHPQPVCFAVAFSSKTEYGLVALIELASIYSGGGVLQVAEIALRQGIPDRYLEQMLTSLRRGGILRSIRGPRGGYQLLRAPAEVAVADVVQVSATQVHPDPAAVEPVGPSMVTVIVPDEATLPPLETWTAKVDACPVVTGAGAEVVTMRSIGMPPRPTWNDEVLLPV